MFVTRAVLELRRSRNRPRLGRSGASGDLRCGSWAHAAAGARYYLATSSKVSSTRRQAFEQSGYYGRLLSHTSPRPHRRERVDPDARREAAGGRFARHAHVAHLAGRRRDPACLPRGGRPVTATHSRYWQPTCCTSRLVRESHARSASGGHRAAFCGAARSRTSRALQRPG